uniref:C2H2-type domain-containing protein n=1 Tax=Rhodosorus marinus TaxID=101924 RepID=A0A7S2ZRL1_9RHOD|mmetsp:Transcript_28847/g.112367  ORF Transcript_28847/g.112367 Transcript_28847/m.112367 type:complete len:494 (+) Transcript_28847:166-1647(+)
MFGSEPSYTSWDTLRSDDGNAVAPYSLIPYETMKSWLLFEVDSSSPLRIEQSALWMSLDAQANEGAVPDTVPNGWLGSLLYCPQEFRDGVTYGTVLGKMDAESRIVDKATRTRFAFDCNSPTWTVYFGGVDDDSGRGWVSKSSLNDDGDVTTSTVTFDVKEPSYILSTTTVEDKKVCDFCCTRGERVCQCPSSFKMRSKMNIDEEYQIVRKSFEGQMAEQRATGQTTFYFTPELVDFACRAKSGVFYVSKSSYSDLKTNVQSATTSQFAKRYAMLATGEQVERGRIAFACNHYSRGSARMLLDSLSQHQFAEIQTNQKALQKSRKRVFEQVEEIDTPSEGDGVSTAKTADTPTPENQCPLCGGIFMRKYEMKRHYRTVHLGERGFTCEFCDKKFIHKTHLRDHISSVHDGVSQAVCSECGKGFATRAKLNRHVLAVHEKRRLHRCEECGKEFFQRSDLKKHVVTHGGSSSSAKRAKKWTASSSSNSLVATRRV